MATGYTIILCGTIIQVKIRRNSMSFLWAACVIGLAGSVHCILMCGPLASGMISASSNGSRLMLRTMLYQTGRITSYLLIGMLFGALGKLVSLLFYQQLLSVVSGVLLLLWVVIMALQRSSSSGRLLKLWSRATSKLFAILRSKKNNRFGVRAGHAQWVFALRHGISRCHGFPEPRKHRV